MRNPSELFDSSEFKEYGSVWWPDLWGEQCRLENEVPYGETAFSTHIVYQAEIMDLKWSNQRNISQESETFLFVLDLNRHMPLLYLSKNYIFRFLIGFDVVFRYLSGRR